MRNLLEKIEPARQQADRRHDDVLDQRRDDGTEGRADDHADRQVDRVALDREFLEFLPALGNLNSVGVRPFTSFFGITTTLRIVLPAMNS